MPVILYKKLWADNFMSLQKPTIVLFDMDGTTVRHINPALLNVLEKLDDAGHKTAKFFSKLLRRPIDTPPLVEIRDGKRPKLLVTRALHKLRRRDVDEIVEPCPGIYDLLNFLQSNGVRMGIISNGLGKGYGHDILEKFDLEKYFEVQIFREDIRRAKPWPDPIIQAADALRQKPQTHDVVWYIGDRRKDIQAALAARAHMPCPVVPLAYNLTAAIAALEHGINPDHIIMAWPELHSKLIKIF